jgi:LysM repeat protein
MKNEHALLRKILGGERKRLRHHVTATVTEEGQWDQPEANNGLARMFVIMLLLHIVVIGAIVLYDFVGDDEAPQASPAVAARHAGTPSPARSNPPVAAAIPVTPQQAALAAAPAASAPAAGFDIYEVRDGDTLASVIESQRVDRDEFLRLNSLSSADTPIETHSILRLPKNRLPAPAASSTPAPLPDTAASTAADEPATTVAAASSAPAPAAAGSPPMVSIPIDPPTAEELAASVQPVTIPAASDEPAPASSAPKAVNDTPPAPEKPKTVALTQPRPVPTPSEMAKKPIVKQEPPAPATKKTDAPKTTAKTTSGKGGSHTLAKGETLYRVAMKHGVSVNDIIRANNIKDPAKLRDGTRLIIPGK